VHLLLWSFAYPFEGPEQDGVLYYTKIPGATTSIRTQILNAFSNSMQTGNADNLPAYTNKTDAYRSWMANGNWTWNSNQTKSRQGNMFLAMNVYTLNTANSTNYLNAASGFVHYMHGVNPNTKVFLSNMKKSGAENYVKQFYHSWFKNGSTLWDENGVSTYGPPPGYIPGGPNPGYGLDPCCSGSCSGNSACLTNVTPPMGQPIQKSYKDFNDDWPVDSWTVTEAGIYTNAAYVRMLSKFAGIGCTTSTGIPNLNSKTTNGNLKLYPNPAEDKLYISFNNETSTSQCSIYSVTGQLIETKNHSTKGINIAEINISHLPSGIYFVELNNSTGKQTARFVKE
jgi:endoglucanase